MKKLISLTSLLPLFLANNVLAQCSINGQAVPCSDMPIWFGIIMTLFVLAFLVLGILSLYRPFIEWSIKFQNKLLGVSTKITPAAIIYRRIMGVMSIVVSIGALIILVNFFSFFYK